MKHSLLAVCALLILMSCAYIAGYEGALDDAWELCMAMEGPGEHPDCEVGMSHLHNDTFIARRRRP